MIQVGGHHVAQEVSLWQALGQMLVVGRYAPLDRDGLARGHFRHNSDIAIVRHLYELININSLSCYRQGSGLAYRRLVLMT